MSFWQTLPKPFFCIAPLANVTDPAFRRIIAKYSKYGGVDIHDKTKESLPAEAFRVGGPDVMWTEFVSADGLFKGGYDALVKDLAFGNDELPIVAQFFSKEPELMKRAAKLAVELGFDGIDINMGCPDQNVCKQGAGAAIIKNPQLAKELIRATKEGVREAGSDIPVSVKTRSGYNEDEIETWIPALLEEKPAALTLHARTKKDMSKVPARWELVLRAVELRDEISPETLIIGNGDVKDVEDARAKAAASGCDGVMFGRAIFGNPWLLSGNPRPGFGERVRVLVEHTKLFSELLPHKSFSIMKKHFKSYLHGEGYSKQLLLDLMAAKTPEEAITRLSEAIS